MYASGYAVDTVGLQQFAQNLTDLAGQLDTNLKTFNLATPDFGQLSAPQFRQAHDLAGRYAQRAAEYDQAITEFTSWAHAMASAAADIAKRYRDLEHLGAASAGDINAVIEQASSTLSTRFYPNSA